MPSAQGGFAFFDAAKVVSSTGSSCAIDCHHARSIVVARPNDYFRANETITYIRGSGILGVHSEVFPSLSCLPTASSSPFFLLVRERFREGACSSESELVIMSCFLF